MPLVRIDLRLGKSTAYRAAISQIVYDAMAAVLNVPANDRFQVITEHDSDGLIYDPKYLGIQRTDDVVFIEITLSQGSHLGAEESLLSCRRRWVGKKSRTPAGGRIHRAGRSREGELVLRQRPRILRDLIGPAASSPATM